jgi:hypothetical protein
MEIKFELRDMALQFSYFMALNEVKIYILIIRCLKKETLVQQMELNPFWK